MGESGTTSSPLLQLQELCRELGIEVPPDTKGCEKLLKQVKVNIVDLMDARRRLERVGMFETYEELRDYSIETERVFPNKEAEDKGVDILLKTLLNETRGAGREKKAEEEHKVWKAKETIREEERKRERERKLEEEEKERKVKETGKAEKREAESESNAKEEVEERRKGTAEVTRKKKKAEARKRYRENRKKRK